MERGAEPAPADEVGAGGHRSGEVDLDDGEVPDQPEQVGGPRLGEQLRPDRDPSRLLGRQHARRSGGTA
ncbi:hypothetical protein [Phycicoccus ginsengisoli]